MDGSPLHGLIHPEMGHIFIPHNRDDDPFPGACPFHGNCFEGLASGLAMELRWGVKAERLEPDHPAWRLEAHYLALGLANLVCVLSPRRIVAGGGVMHNLELVSHAAQESAGTPEWLRALPRRARVDRQLSGAAASGRRRRSAGRPDSGGKGFGGKYFLRGRLHFPGVISIQPSAGTTVAGSPSCATVTRKRFPERGASNLDDSPLGRLHFRRAAFEFDAELRVLRAIHTHEQGFVIAAVEDFAHRGGSPESIAPERGSGR